MTKLPARIKVLVVDDSSLMRKAISDSLSQDLEIEVVGTALDPYIARDKILTLKPDVLTLDIDMPRMDGITFLKILMEHHPIPIVILSSMTREGSEKAMEALNAGAVDVMVKPDNSAKIKEFGKLLVEKVKTAVQAKRFPRKHDEPKRKILVLNPSTSHFHPRQVILMGASTGGVEALTHVLTNLPKEMPPICVVQHIPPEFTNGFASRLCKFSSAHVKVAQDGEAIEPGIIYIAPGGIHFTLQWQQDRYLVKLTQSAPVWHQRPSVDVLFESVESTASENTVAVLMTGMGKDGAEGMRKLKSKGAITIAQNETTCAIFGMPKAAIDAGAVTEVLGLDEIPEYLVKTVQGSRMTTR